MLLMAYGTPRHPNEIAAYYTDIRHGRPPTDEQLAELTARYEAIGGLSPLAARTEAQRDALQLVLDAAAPGRYHVVLGLKHAEPRIESAVATRLVVLRHMRGDDQAHRPPRVTVRRLVQCNVCCGHDERAR